MSKMVCSLKFWSGICMATFLTGCSQPPAELVDNSRNIYSRLEVMHKMETRSGYSSGSVIERGGSSTYRDKNDKIHEVEEELLVEEAEEVGKAPIHNTQQTEQFREVVGSNYGLKTPMNRTDFMWPLDGKILHHYDKSAGVEGLNIAAAIGKAVASAAQGKVIYVGDDLKEYGNLVIIKHADNLLTAYAHLSKIQVAKNDVVERGQVIGSVGTTGGVNTPQLHFSVRKGDITIDPEKRL